MEFTKEEISLCEQIVKKHRKYIECGDWMIIEGDPHVVPTLYVGQDFPITKRTMLPLWTISDCLEFLIGKGMGGIYFGNKPSSKFIDCYRYDKDDILIFQFQKTGKTLLEACLKAVLENK